MTLIPREVVERTLTHQPADMACYPGKHHAESSGVDAVALTSNVAVNYDYPSVFVMAEAILWCHEDFDEIMVVLS
jgi:hypothetical protein